jgi:hypothetical protein
VGGPGRDAGMAAAAKGPVDSAARVMHNRQPT